MTSTMKGKRISQAKTKQPLISREEHLQIHFPCEGSEVRVDYRPVGGNNFRVNFWSDRGVEGAFGKEMYISRSHYVVLKKNDKGEWTHEIL